MEKLDLPDLEIIAVAARDGMKTVIASDDSGAMALARHGNSSPFWRENVIR